MGQMSEYFANEMLKLTFNRDTYTPVYNRFEVALVTQIPTLNSDLLDLVEPVGAGYARQYISFAASAWGLTGFREAYTLADVTFPVVATSGYWGVIEGYALITSHSTNTITKQLVAVGRFTDPLRATEGIQPQLPAGTIQFGIYD